MEEAEFEPNAAQKVSSENLMEYLLHCLCGLEPILGQSLVHGERSLFDRRDHQLRNLDPEYLLVSSLRLMRAIAV